MHVVAIPVTAVCPAAVEVTVRTMCDGLVDLHGRRLHVDDAASHVSVMVVSCHDMASPIVLVDHDAIRSGSRSDTGVGNSTERQDQSCGNNS
jgi:hypothetical protein